MTLLNLRYSLPHYLINLYVAKPSCSTNVVLCAKPVYTARTEPPSSGILSLKAISDLLVCEAFDKHEISYSLLVHLEADGVTHSSAEEGAYVTL